MPAMAGITNMRKGVAFTPRLNLFYGDTFTLIPYRNCGNRSDFFYFVSKLRGFIFGTLNDISLQYHLVNELL